MSHLSESHLYKSPNALARRSRNRVERPVDFLTWHSFIDWCQEPSLAEEVECCLKDRLHDCR